MADKPLNPKQVKFADFYAETGNAEQSAIRAGYSPKYARGHASDMVANSGIKALLAERNKQLESERIANMTEVKQFWTEMLRSDGVAARDRLKAAELLARTNGAFLDRQELTGSGGGAITIVSSIPRIGGE